MSDWTIAEVASAVARAVRTRVLERKAAQEALIAVDSWMGRAAERVEIVSADIREAELIIRTLGTSLRAPDARHLVVARRTGLPLLSFDAAMVRDAASLGIVVVN